MTDGEVRRRRCGGARGSRCRGRSGAAGSGKILASRRSRCAA